MPASEFREWQIFENIEPFGERGEYFRTALICFVVAKAGGIKSVQFDDFIVETLKAQKEKQGPEAIKAMMMMLKAKQDEYLKRKAAEEAQQNGGDSGH